MHSCRHVSLNSLGSLLYNLSRFNNAALCEILQHSFCLEDSFSQVWVPKFFEVEVEEGVKRTRIEDFVAGEIIEEIGEICTVQCADGEKRKMKKKDLSEMNPPKFDGVEDCGMQMITSLDLPLRTRLLSAYYTTQIFCILQAHDRRCLFVWCLTYFCPAQLSHLNEPAVFHNLRVRYDADLIYTNSGLFLVAINPYFWLPIYSDFIVEYYKGKKRSDVAPHIFAVADSAYRAMMTDRMNQSMLITVRLPFPFFLSVRLA